MQSGWNIRQPLQAVKGNEKIIGDWLWDIVPIAATGLMREAPAATAEAAEEAMTMKTIHKTLKISKIR